jgi:hypothetical protein
MFVLFSSDALTELKVNFEKLKLIVLMISQTFMKDYENVTLRFFYARLRDTKYLEKPQY